MVESSSVALIAESYCTKHKYAREVLAVRRLVGRNSGVVKTETDEGLLSGTQSPAIYSVNNNLSRFDQWVVVLAAHKRSLGFLGPHGIWRDVNSGCPIDNVESWQPLHRENQHHPQAAAS